MRRQDPRSFLFGVLASTLVVGCSFAKIDEKLVDAPARPVSGARPTQKNERDDRPPTLTATATAANDVVDIDVESDTECRKVESTPMEQERTTVRTMNGAYGYKTNESPQFFNVVTTLALAGGGGALLAWDCTKDSDNPCSQGAANGIRATGFILLGLGAVAAAAFTTNAIRAADSHEIVKAPTLKKPEPWARCETRPVANYSLTVSLGPSKLQSTTDAAGHAVVDLTGIVMTGDELPATARIVGNGVPDATIDLRSTPAFARWQRERDERARAKERAALTDQLGEVSKKVEACDSTKDARVRRGRRRELVRGHEPAEYVEKHCTPRREMIATRAECRDANNFVRPCTKQVAGDIVGFACQKTLDEDLVKLGLYQLGLSSGYPFPEDRQVDTSDTTCDRVSEEQSRLNQRLQALQAGDSR